MRTQLLILLVIIFFSCENKKEQSTRNWEIPIVKDSLPITNKYFKTKKIRKPLNQLLFIGAHKDSIQITKNSLNINTYYSENTKYNDTLNTGHDIEIISDLTQELSVDLEHFSIPPPPVIIEGDEYKNDESKTDSIFKIWKKRPRNYVKSYPVFIRNITKDTIHIDNQDGALFLIQEAKNELGEWKPIEYWTYSKCGNSYATTPIGQNDILILKKVNYQGPFETVMRLKLRTNNKIIYSNEFKGSINIEQFDLDNLNSFTKRRLDNSDKEYIFLNK